MSTKEETTDRQLTLEERLAAQREALEVAKQQVAFLTGTVAILEELLKEDKKDNGTT